MLVKFDAQKVFKEAHKRKMIRADLQDIVGFMFTDVIERLNPFDDAVEIDITDRLIEGVAIKTSTVRGISGKPREVNDVFEAARLRTAGEKVIYREEPKKR